MAAIHGLDISKLNEALGAYSRKYSNTIKTLCYQKQELEECMSDVPGVTDEYVTFTGETSNVLQPYQCGWTEPKTDQPIVGISTADAWTGDDDYAAGSTVCYNGLEYTNEESVVAGEEDPENNDGWQFTGLACPPSKEHGCIPEDNGKNCFTICPVINKVRQIKINKSFKCLDDLYRSYLAFLTNENQDKKDWPIVKWLVEKLLFPKMHEELNEISSLGTYQQPIPGIAGHYLQSTDGILTIRDNLLLNGDITPIPTGPFDPTTIFQQVEDFVGSIPSKYRKKRWKLLMSEANAFMLAQDYRNSFSHKMCCETDKDGRATKYTFGNVTLEIVSVCAWDGTDILMYISRDNMIRMYDKILNPMKLKMQSLLDCLYLWASFKRGYGFRCAEEIFTNEMLSTDEPEPPCDDQPVEKINATRIPIPDFGLNAADWVGEVQMSRQPNETDCMGFVVTTPLGSVTMDGTWGDSSSFAAYGADLLAIGVQKIGGGALDASNFSFSTGSPYEWAMIGAQNSQDIEVSSFFKPGCNDACLINSDSVTELFVCDLEIAAVSRVGQMNDTSCADGTWTLREEYTMIPQNGIPPYNIQWEVEYHPSTNVTPANQVILGPVFNTGDWDRSNDVNDFFSNDMQGFRYKAIITDATGCKCEYNGARSGSAPSPCGNSSNILITPVSPICDWGVTGFSGRNGTIQQNDTTGDRAYLIGGAWTILGNIINAEVSVRVNGNHITGSPFQFPNIPTHIYVKYSEYNAGDTITVDYDVVTDKDICQESWTAVMVKP